MIVRPSVSKIEKAKSRKLCSEIASCAAFLSVMEPDSSASSALTVVRKESASSDSVLSVRCIAFWRRITYVAMASTMSTHVRAAVYHSVRRTRTELSIAAIPGTAGFARSGLVAAEEHVSRAAPCMKQRLRRTRVDFSANPVHVHLNKIGERVESFIPNMFRDFCPAHHAAGVARKEFDQSILFCRKRYRPAPPRNILPNRIHNQVRDND